MNSGSNEALCSVCVCASSFHTVSQRWPVQKESFLVTVVTEIHSCQSLSCSWRIQMLCCKLEIHTRARSQAAMLSASPHASQAVN